MDKRAENVLFAVVQSYINELAPVGSRNIHKKYHFNISSATIRNSMSDLEEMGYLKQPHTSAGRIPTDKGYKFYIESILNNLASDEDLLSILYNNLVELKGDLNEFLNGITRILSNYSHYLGITLSTSAEQSTLRKIELFSYQDNRIAVILLTDDVIKHKIIESDGKLTQSDLNRITSFLNAEFVGYTLGEIKRNLIDNIYKEKIQRDNLLAKALRLCKGILSTIDNAVYIYGISELLGQPDFSDIKNIKNLSKAIEDKYSIIKLLDQISNTEGVKACIGCELYLKNKDLSLVASSFHEKGKPSGVLGLIGPKRMDYENAISIVDTTAKFLSKILDER